jgi:hypothetical protein
MCRCNMITLLEPELITRSHVSANEREIMIRAQVGNDFHSPLSFVGTLDHCAQHAECLRQSGVDEIACLIDFGIDYDEVMNSLKRLSTLLS